VKQGGGDEGFAARLSLALQACNLSRSQLPSILGVHKSMVSRWLSGDMKPTSYNLARISTEIAKQKPGFNMRLWTAPRVEFDAALGLSIAASPTAVQAATESQPTGVPIRRLRLWGFAAGASAIVILAVGVWMLWRSGHPTAEQIVPSAPSAPSVAVMPFLNMSGDSGKDYLGDGIAEEILNDLANTPNLRVASRTSSFSFRGRQADIGEIAHKLGVQAVLEGSVRQEGNSVRVIAQLIDARDGFHLWSARYDRRLEDVLSLQDEIARAIAAALDRKLVTRDASRRPLARQRIDPNAYTAYLQGQFFLNKRDADDVLRAIDFFKEAIKFAPGYADAHASLALAYERILSNGQRRDTLDLAAEQVAAALRLDPDNFMALLADAQVKRASWDWSGAFAAMRTLLRHYPNNADVHHFYAVLLEGLNLWDQALTEQRRAAELDPLSPIYRDNVGQALHYLHRDKEAIAEAEQALVLEHDYEFSLGTMCVSYADTGQLRKATEILHDRLMPLYAEGENTIACASDIAYRARNNRELRRLADLAEHLYARGALGASYVPFPYVFMRDYERAAYWLEKAYDDHDYGVFYFVKEPDVPAESAANARWKTLLQRPAFTEAARMRAQVMVSDPGSD
jgi:TolB-like protein/transcriptional regulator with XRE-family HTH domain/Tfp pilus assembly protein PilF